MSFIHMSQSNTPKNKSFLPYIGGLRGIAILMIVCFHIWPQHCSQGYLGVDIFLVISGYLLFRSHQTEHSFQFRKFVSKKILRIMPPFLCVVLLTCIIVPFLFVDEGEFVRLGSSAIYSIFAYSNNYYHRLYSDYFSPGANLNPLLHTWYLAVILQIYLLWAVGCAITAKILTRATQGGLKHLL